MNIFLFLRYYTPIILKSKKKTVFFIEKKAEICYILKNIRKTGEI